jgi:hypothetical protein
VVLASQLHVPARLSVGLLGGLAEIVGSDPLLAILISHHSLLYLAHQVLVPAPSLPLPLLLCFSIHHHHHHYHIATYYLTHHTPPTASLPNCSFLLPHSSSFTRLIAPSNCSPSFGHSSKESGTYRSLHLLQILDVCFSSLTIALNSPFPPIFDLR